MKVSCQREVSRYASPGNNMAASPWVTFEKVTVASPHILHTDCGFEVYIEHFCSPFLVVTCPVEKEACSHYCSV